MKTIEHNMNKLGKHQPHIKLALPQMVLLLLRDVIRRKPISNFDYVALQTIIWVKNMIFLFNRCLENS